VGELAKTKSISLEDARRAVDQTTPILDFKTAHERDQAFGDVWAEYSGGRYSVHLRVTDGSDPDSLSRTLKEAIGSDVQLTVSGLQYIAALSLVDEVSKSGILLTTPHSKRSLLSRPTCALSTRKLNR